jgi:hypothetical protein
VTTQADLVTRLAMAGVGVLTTTLFAGSGTPAPDRGDGPFTFVVMTPGERPVITHNDGGIAISKPRAQIVVRARDSLVAEARAWMAYEALDLTNVIIGTTRYLKIRPLQEPFDMGREENDLYRWGFNVSLDRAA